MYESLRLLNELPENTKVYCAHEYTKSNLLWALSIYPNDVLIKKRLESVIKRREEGLLTIPTTILEERETNLFIRAKDVEEFSQLRLHKDNWRE